MPWLSRLRSLWRNLVHRDRVDQDLDDELLAVQQVLVDEHLRSGLSPAEAQRRAALTLGGVESVKQQVRETRTGASLNVLTQDVRYAVRILHRNPLFSLTAALSLTIGIGAPTTIFTVVNAMLLRPPPGVVDPNFLVDIGRTSQRSRFDSISYPNYLDIAQRATTLDGVYAAQVFADPMSLVTAEGAERLFGCSVTTNYFTVLGARPTIGRVFDSADDVQAGASPVAVLSHAYWTRRFHQDPAIVGRVLQINAQPVTVIGVASEGFQGTGIAATDVWLPISMAPLLRPSSSAMLTIRRDGWLRVGGRLAPGASLAQASAELELIAQALEREHPDENRGRGLRAVARARIPDFIPVGTFLALLMAIGSLVLVIACTNLASVLLARATARRREIAIRLAVGAGRRRLIAQLLIETMMLFVLGCAGGLLLARWMTTVMVGLLPTLPVPIDMSLPLDGRVLAFAVALSFVSAVLSGLAPAWHASKADVVAVLKDETQTLAGRDRMRSAFVIGQVALSLVLVVAAGLFARALQNAGTIDPGFDPHGVELAALDLSLVGPDEARRAFMRQLADRVRALPSVEAATVAGFLPMGDALAHLPNITVPGETPPDGQPHFEADWSAVEPGYFSTMRIPLVAGRDFSETDRAGTQPVVIVGEAAAHLFWPGQHAIGKSLRLEANFARKEAKTVIVVGIARDVKHRSLREERPVPLVYFPLQQETRSRVFIVARTTQGQRITQDLRSLVASLNPHLIIATAQTIEDMLALNLVPQRIAASVAGSLGTVGVLLAAIGIYGVTAYAVARRTREIGIRIALGAERGTIVAIVLGEGMSLVFIGAAIGLVLAAGTSQLLTRWLFGLPPFDPVTFGGAALAFAAIGLAASYAPVRRATRIDAMEALRYE